jgi:branched-chain amino acid transport system substrate-binding protein
LTGVAADPAKEMVNGIKLYLEQVHYQMAGRKVELVVENDESNPATAMARARKLIEQDKVDLIDGLLLTNIGYAVAPVTDYAKVPLIVCVSAADNLTQRKHYNWLIRLSFTCSGPSHPFGDWVYKTLHYKRIVTFGMDYPYGYEVVGGFQQSYEEAGGKVVQKLWGPLGFKDFTSFIKKIRPDADAIFLLTTSAPAEVIPRQLKAAGINLPVVAGTSTYDESVLRLLGDEAIGAISVSPYAVTLDNPVNKKFVADYRAKFAGNNPGMFAEQSYSSAMWIDKAIESIKGDVEDKQKLMDALKKVQMIGPGGPMKLDEYNNLVENFYVRKVEKVNGHLQNKVIFTFPNVSQFWKYNPATYLKQPPYGKDYPLCKFCSE